MTDPEKYWLKGLILGIVAGTVLGATAGCALVKPTVVKVVEEAPLPDPRVDLAAVKFYDCGQLTFVAFIKETGGAEGAVIKGPAHLDDMNLRLTLVPYENVHYFENSRPCGFAVQEKDVL